MQGGTPLAATGSAFIGCSGNRSYSIRTDRNQEVNGTRPKEISITEIAANAIEFRLLPLVLVVRFEGYIGYQVDLAIQRARWQQDFLDLNSRRIAGDEVSAILQAVDTGGKGGFTPVDYLAAKPDIELVLAGQRAACVQEIIEHFEAVAVLIDGARRELPEVGVAVGKLLAVVVGEVILFTLLGVLVVHIVVVAARAGEYAIVEIFEIHLGNKGRLVLRQAAALEVVVTVIGVNQHSISSAVGFDIAAVLVAKLVSVRFRYPHLHGIGNIRIPVEVPLTVVT